MMIAHERILRHIVESPLVGAHVVPRCAKRSADMPRVGVSGIGRKVAATAAIQAVGFTVFRNVRSAMTLASR